MYPNFEYSAVQSLSIFADLPFFAILYCIWLLLLLLLLFSKGGRSGNDWEKLVLVCVFAVVFLDFWTLVFPYGRWIDEIGAAAHVNYLQEHGQIAAGNLNFGYFDFPALHLLTLYLSQTTGMEIFATRVVLLFFHSLILAALLYVLFRRYFNNPYIAGFAALLVIQGDIWLSRRHGLSPGNFALLLLVAFLVLLTIDKQRLFGTVRSILLMVILFVAATSMHFVTSVCLAFILLGIYLTQKLSKENMLGLSTVVFCITVILGWESYCTFLNLNTLVNFVPRIIEDFSEADILYFFRMIRTANTKGAPLWANITQFSWLILIYAFGTILGLVNLIRVKNLTSTWKRLAGAFLGVILLSGVTVLASPGGGQFERFLQYGAFFCVPFLLWFLLNLNEHWKKRSLVLLAALFFVLSLPTFLAHNSNICTLAIHSHELSAGEFLAETRTKDTELTVFAFGATTKVHIYYSPDVNYRRVPSPSLTAKETIMWEEADALVESFEHRAKTHRDLLVFSLKEELLWEHLFGSEVAQSKWVELENQLSRNNKLYSNNYVIIYKP